MSGKTRHECERCGHQWLARNNAFYDELVEWIQHVDELESDYRYELARLERRLAQATGLVEMEAHRRAAEEFDQVAEEAAARLAAEESELAF